jgi:hypothetical protein
MTDDDLQDLTNARNALIRERSTRVKTLAAPGAIANGALDALIKVQQAIDVIDRAIEELEEAMEEDDDEEEDDE